jgi:hypothetical protein
MNAINEKSHAFTDFIWYLHKLYSYTCVYIYILVSLNILVAVSNVYVLTNMVTEFYSTWLHITNDNYQFHKDFTRECLLGYRSTGRNLIQCIFLSRNLMSWNQSIVCMYRNLTWSWILFRYYREQHCLMWYIWTQCNWQSNYAYVFHCSRCDVVWSVL